MLLLVIIIMSNQTTDNGVTKVIPFVFSFLVPIPANDKKHNLSIIQVF